MTTKQDNTFLPFPLGTKVFTVNVVREVNYVTCPECGGTKHIRIVAHAAEYVVECEACYHFGNPTGKVRKDTIQVIPQEIILKDVTLDAGEFTYFTAIPEVGKARVCYPVEELFLTKEDCLPLCQKKREEIQAREDAQLEAEIRQNRNRVAFTYRYWKGNAAKLEKQLEYARNKCKLLKGN